MWRGGEGGGRRGGGWDVRPREGGRLPLRWVWVGQTFYSKKKRTTTMVINNVISFGKEKTRGNGVVRTGREGGSLKPPFLSAWERKEKVGAIGRRVCKGSL